MRHKNGSFPRSQSATCGHVHSHVTHECHIFLAPFPNLFIVLMPEKWPSRRRCCCCSSSLTSTRKISWKRFVTQTCALESRRTEFIHPLIRDEKSASDMIQFNRQEGHKDRSEHRTGFFSNAMLMESHKQILQTTRGTLHRVRRMGKR